MKNELLTEQDQKLVQQTKNILSRRMDIPSTPRDIHAVLMQAAEQQKQSASSSIFSSLFLRYAAGLAVIALLSFAGLWSMKSVPVESVTATSVSEAPLDTGLDLAEWDLEVETLFNDVDSSLTTLAEDDTSLNSLAEGLLNNKESRL